MGILLLAVTAWVLVDVLLPRELIIPAHPKVYPEQTPAKDGIPFENLRVFTADGLTLRGWFVHAASGTPLGTVIVLHGKSSCKEHMLILARLLASNRYNAIVYDSRAHGESDGVYCTYGIKEKEDVSRCLDEAQKRYGDLGAIGVIGTSFGGAVAIQALAEDKRFCCGIVASPYCNLEETASHEMKKIIHFDWPWLLRRVLDRGGRQAGFRVADINPEKTAKLVTCPVLVIHGEKDERFPVAWAKRVHDNLPSPQKQWYLAKGNGHDDMFWHHDAENVKARIVQFLAQHMRKESVAP
jgi:pimeloyl-ACP methyl ester carboxylesterase